MTPQARRPIKNWLQEWIPWLIPKIPLVVAAGYAAYQGVTSDWGRSLSSEQAVQAVFAMLVGWLTSEGLEVGLNRWRDQAQIKDRLEQFDSKLVGHLR